MCRNGIVHEAAGWSEAMTRYRSFITHKNITVLTTINPLEAPKDARSVNMTRPVTNIISYEQKLQCLVQAPHIAMPEVNNSLREFSRQTHNSERGYIQILYRPQSKHRHANHRLDLP